MRLWGCHAFQCGHAAGCRAAVPGGRAGRPRRRVPGGPLWPATRLALSCLTLALHLHPSPTRAVLALTTRVAPPTGATARGAARAERAEITAARNAEAGARRAEITAARAEAGARKAEAGDDATRIRSEERRVGKEC